MLVFHVVFFFQTLSNYGNFPVSEEMKLSLNLMVLTVYLVPIHNCQSPKVLGLAS